MTAFITYESYLARPEQILTPAKLQNLNSILLAISDAPGGYLSMVDIRKLTGFQTGQVYAAMDQQGMKVLFTGKGIAFGLSPVGKDVVNGKAKLTLGGIVKSNTPANGIKLLSPDEYREIIKDDKVKELLEREQNWLEDMLIDRYAASYQEAGGNPERERRAELILKVLSFKFSRVIAELNQIAHSGEPILKSFTQIAGEVNGAKIASGTIHPLGDEVHSNE